MKADAAPLSAEEEGPRTNAGRDLWEFLTNCSMEDLGWRPIGDDILAIEAEARASGSPTDAAHRPVLRSVTGTDDMQIECACGWLWDEAADPNEPEGADFIRHLRAASGSPTDAALPDERDFVAARLMESAWGTRANLDMSEARIVANYLRSFGIGRAASGSPEPVLDVERARRAFRSMMDKGLLPGSFIHDDQWADVFAMEYGRAEP